MTERLRKALAEFGRPDQLISEYHLAKAYMELHPFQYQIINHRQAGIQMTEESMELQAAIIANGRIQEAKPEIEYAQVDEGFIERMRNVIASSSGIPPRYLGTTSAAWTRKVTAAVNSVAREMFGYTPKEFTLQLGKFRTINLKKNSE